MPKRPRTQAKIEAERRYKEKHKRVHLVFNSDNPQDNDLLTWLRSQVTNDSEIPALIKKLASQARDNQVVPTETIEPLELEFDDYHLS